MKFVLGHALFLLLTAATATAIIQELATEQHYQQEQGGIDEKLTELLAIVGNANNRVLARNTRALKTGEGKGK
jgi:hypothetical protein